jgi:putative ABC transport system permease protein
MTGSWREFLFALRQFRRSPGLAASVAITIGLGVGANLAVFALLADAFLPAAPYADASSLAVIENTGLYYYEGAIPEGLADPKVSGPDFEDLVARQHAFATVGGFADDHVAVMRGADRPRTVCRIFVAPTLFDVLQVQPVRGRLLARTDFADDAPGVALVTEGLWRSVLASDAGVVGRAITLDEQPFTIAGVLPTQVFDLLVPRKGLFDEGARDRCVVTPFARGRQGESESIIAYTRAHRDSPWLRVVGRLRPGMSLDRARAETSALGTELREENRALNRNRGLSVVSLEAWRTAGVSQLLLMLAIAAVLAFLVACANAAGLVLTDSVTHEPELAIRQALGAGPARLLRVVLVRSILWALPGAVLGLVFGMATLALVRWGASAGSTTLRTVHIGPLVLFAGLGLTLVAGLLAGALTAWTLRRRNLFDSLREAGQAASLGRRRSRTTKVLVAVQVAVAASLAIGSALLVRSMWNVVQTDRGFDIERGFVVQVRLPRSKYGDIKAQAEFYRQAVARIRALDGVTAAAVSVAPPLTNSSVALGGALEVETPAGRKAFERLSAQVVTSGYMDAVGLRLVRGRFFSPAEELSNAPVVVVDEAFCRAHLGGADPLASALHFGRDRLAIVGVVRDVRQATERESALAVRFREGGMAYMLFGRFGRPPAWSYLVVRAAGNPAQLTDAATRELLAVDPAACLDDPRTFAQLFASRVAERRRVLGLLGSFAAIVLLLTALSLTAALSQFVAVHSREIAIRLALGASRRRIVLLSSRQVGASVLVGLLLGAGGGLLIARALASQLFQVEPTDAPTIAAAVALLVALAIAAAAGPVWRASRVEPSSTLRAL